jgi:hypothetical protein
VRHQKAGEKDDSPPSGLKPQEVGWDHGIINGLWKRADDWNTRCDPRRRNRRRRRFIAHCCGVSGLKVKQPRIENASGCIVAGGWDFFWEDIIVHG